MEAVSAYLPAQAKGSLPVELSSFAIFSKYFNLRTSLALTAPLRAITFEMELPGCNTDTFQIYLNEFFSTNPHEFKIIHCVSN